MIREFKNYFAITKKEWNGMVVVVVIIALVLAAPYLLSYFHPDEVVDQEEFKQAITRLQNDKTAIDRDSAFKAKQEARDPHPVMFHFNPNNLSVVQWLKLGLSEHQVAGIKNYKAKGGRFYSKADVKKMYTLTSEDYARLEPYIDLPDSEAGLKKEGLIIELNTADSAQLTRLRGIGPAFAMRIVNYRKQLGGFWKKEQLQEIYGVDSLKFRELAKQFTIDPKKITKLQINQVSVDDLRRFPYLNFKQMNAIVEYRKQHGNYKSVDDLKDIALLDEEILRKIAPYLAYK